MHRDCTRNEQVRLTACPRGSAEPCLPAGRSGSADFAKGRIMAKWYWMKDGQKHGPVNTAHLKQLARAGQLQPTDMIWRDGLPDWVTASKTKGLFKVAQAATASGSPPPLPTNRVTGGTPGLAPPLPPAGPVFPAPQRRPVSVTVLAVLSMISAILGLLSLPFTIGTLTGAIPTSEAAMLLYEDPVYHGWAVIGIPLSVLACTAWIVTSVGLWRMRGWSRTAALWLLGYGALMSVVSFIVICMAFSAGPFPSDAVQASQAARSERSITLMGSLGGALGGLVYCLVFAILMTKQKVVDAFARASPQ